MPELIKTVVVLTSEKRRDRQSKTLFYLTHSFKNRTEFVISQGNSIVLSKI